MTVVNQNLPIPAEYQQASQRFSIIWNEYVSKEEEAKNEVVNMVKILESIGYSRTKAFAKIISDHKHLKGFSRATLYRELPDTMKRKYESSDIIMLPYYSDVSNETFDEEEEETEIDDTTTNEIKFTTKDVTAEVMEKLRLDSIMRKQRWDDEIRRNKILEQLPKEVVEYANKTGGLSGLSTNKLELLINKRLKPYPELQKHLIDKIIDKEKTTDEIKITDNQASDIVHQTISDVEVGYLTPDSTGKVFTYSGDPLKRDLIKGNKTEVKDPTTAYFDIIKSIRKLCENLTGNKLEQIEKYTDDHFKYTKEYRQEIIRSIDDKRELIHLNNQMILIADYLDDFIPMIKEALDDFDKKPNIGI
jgi:hypothetical protein